MVMSLPVTLLLGLACLLLLASPQPYLAPLAVAALSGLALLYRRPGWGLLALLALVPLEGLFAGSAGLTPSKLLGAALLLVVSLQLLLGQRPGALRSNLWPLLLGFLAWYLLSLLLSSDLDASLQHLRQLAVGLALFFIALAVCRELDLLLLARLVSLSVAASALFALLTASASQRASGLLADPNYFALLLTFASPLTLLLVLRAPGWPQRLFWLAMLGLLVAALLRSGSRSGLLVLLFTLLLAAWHHRQSLARHLPRHFGGLLLALAIAVPLAPALLPDSLVQRLEALTSLRSGASAYADNSLARRSSYLLVGSAMIRDNPLLGSGPGTFPQHFAHSGYAIAFAYKLDPQQLYREAHNTYLGMFSETGVPGGLLFAGLLLLSLRNLQVARRHWLAQGDTEQAMLATHLGLSLVALACFLLMLSVPSHKYLWVMLAVASHLRLQARDAAARPARPCEVPS